MLTSFYIFYFIFYVQFIYNLYVYYKNCYIYYLINDRKSFPDFLSLIKINKKTIILNYEKERRNSFTHK